MQANDVERGLAQVLACVVNVESVPVDSHFFDDLGADSMVMARFCARVRKRGDLPSVSMQDVYRHSTIRGLAASLADRAPGAGQPAPATAVGAAVPPPTAGMEPVGRVRYALCGVLQLLFFLGYAALAALVLESGFVWISAGSGLVDVYLRSVAVGSALFFGLCALPILVKWVLVGRWKPQEIPVWSMAYYRFWLVKTLIQRSPAALFVGSPLYAVYLRALGAKVGRGAVILSKNVPVCTDMLEIGDGAVIRKDSFFTGYRAHDGIIQTGAVSIGKGALVGEVTVLDIWTSLGDGAQLGHSSSLHGGQTVPAGERWHGSPAQRTDVNYQVVSTMDVGPLRRVVFVTVQMVNMLLLGAPLAFGGAVLALAAVPQLASLLEPGPVSFTSWTFHLDALVLSGVLFFGAILAGLLFVGTVPRLLNLAIKPLKVYPLYGFHYWAQRAIARTTNRKFYTRLFGDSSYIVHYLHWLGYDLRGVQQTGSNFGEDVKHDNPFLCAVGSGTMIADGLSIINTDFSSTSFRLSRVSIGAHNFLGNRIAYPARGKTGDDCLLATKLMVPVDGQMREGVGLLGAPGFEIPRSVQRDKQLDLGSKDELRRRLRAKNIHNVITMALFLLVRWSFFFAVTVLYMAAMDLWASMGALAVALATAGAFLFGVVHFVLVDRVFRPLAALRPQGCSIYDRAFWRHERFWKICTDAYLQMFNGTPFKTAIWRLLGVRIGRRVFDDGLSMTERTFTTIGDNCTFNAGSVIQCHSQEDGGFKSDRTAIGAGCTLGVGAFVHYGVTMGDGAVLAADSFLMKGEEMPPQALWGGNPARRVSSPLRRDDSMNTRIEIDREFWRGVLLAGGATAIPRWTLDPVPGVADHIAPLDCNLVVELRRFADRLDLPLHSVALAAHARVLAALSGERDVVTGYADRSGRRALPCPLSTQADSWRALLLDTVRVETDLVRHREFAVDELQRELGVAGPSFETVFDPTGAGGDLGENAVLWVTLATYGERLSLHLRYRTDALDARSVARIAGYHLAALALMVAHPDTEHRRASLLSSEELRFQLDGLAGPRRELPDRRFHELFEERVRMHPDAVAAVHRGRQWTYRELNVRANRLGRALLARGLRREGVVAVVTERNLDWMAAVIAIFKAGGVYLPIEPHFPADRIARTLARAGCTLVLTEPGSTTTLDKALATLPGVQKVLVGDAGRHPGGDLRINVAADQLAYIYFTSGSTGEPKGAMCEHAGMLNHLHAKIADLGIREGEVVAQVAPQCFDISLWQLVSALLVGGRTVLVEQDVILDVARFVDTIERQRVGVVQVVPSYLEVVLSYLEQHRRALPGLRCVSATGEALKPELAQRYFAARPGSVLVNAYGLTETSDDTNHEVMHEPPEGDRMPLGPAVQNVRVYVVDEQLNPVPLGAPGLIAFSGVCVGRGYVNDPDRTRAAYLADPHRPGERLYKGGDFGRWRPDGKLEFLGRRDSQVKISGFRIEIGEIDNTLLRVPGVRDAAVVVAERPDRGKFLVAFYSGEPLQVELLRDRLGASLPHYMIPTAFHRRDSLPLTANGKIDTKALAALAAELAVTDDYDAPVTATERRLAIAWANLLGIASDRIGRRDHFFDLGGSSLSAVKLAITLNRAASLEDIIQHPVLAELAELIDGIPDRHSGLHQSLSGTELRGLDAQHAATCRVG